MHQGSTDFNMGHFFSGPELDKTHIFINDCLVSCWKHVLNLHYRMSKARNVLHAMPFMAANRKSSKRDFQDLWMLYMLMLKIYLKDSNPHKQAALQLKEKWATHHNALMSGDPYVPKLIHQSFIDKYGFDMLDTMLTTDEVVQKFVDHF
jgi:hypothetical protein